MKQKIMKVLGYKYTWWICTIVIYFICLSVIPIEGNYKVNSLNEKTNMMNITYSSIIPFVTHDTIVKAPVIIYGRVLEHKLVQTDKGLKYLTITNVKGVNYVFEDQKTYKYIELNAKDSLFKCEERFWPEHYVTTIPN